MTARHSTLNLKTMLNEKSKITITEEGDSIQKCTSSRDGGTARTFERTIVDQSTCENSVLTLDQFREDHRALREEHAEMSDNDFQLRLQQ
jgi:hypothetical protein